MVFCEHFNRNHLLSLLLGLFMAGPCMSGSLDRPDNTGYVNPFIGTGGHGHTFPGATLPFGMVQLSPDTRTEGWDACGGYHYTDKSILGFSHTHLSGTGIGDMGDILFMPFVGDAQIVPGPEDDPNAGYRSRFSHEKELAEPGYYRVHLSDYDIVAELTTTLRSGFHRYSYPAGAEAGLVIDLSHAIHDTENPITELKVINNREVEGYKRTRGWAQNHHVYFHARFNRPFVCTLYENGQVQTGRWAAANGDVQAVLQFDDEDNTVLAKVGISAVDYDGARKNLEAEILDWDFDGVRENARTAWRRQLSKIDINGGTADEKIIFYTALYHSFISPYLFTDADGRYRGIDQQIHENQDRPIYTVFSLWDTFRAFHPLMTIIEADRTNAFIKTLLTHYEQGGLLPKWELAANYTGTMDGYHAVSVIVDAYMKGIRDYDIDKAYRAIVKSSQYHQDAVILCPNERIYDRLNSKAKYFYNELGYIPCELYRKSVSEGLEYAYDDWCIARMAYELGKTQDAAAYEKRAKNYRHYFDSETKFMRAKKSDGSWKEPFNPRHAQMRYSEYTEGNAWQWTFFVPHDVAGLAELMGGKQDFLAKLDELFSMDSQIDGEYKSSDITGLIGQYAHGNEPSHHITHMYNYMGQPWKTQELADKIMSTLYLNNPDGLCGNEDCGQMSAWYVLNAMGFYSSCPGDPVYSLGRPIFDEAAIQVGQGKTFSIRALNNRSENKYIQSARLNGVELESPFFTHKQLVRGGVLELTMGAEPNKKIMLNSGFFK
jgi:predicted alpha-1,2-mannosidase